MTDKHLFIAYRQGVYMRGIVGVFETRKAAKAACHQAEKAEMDDYHDFEIMRIKLGNIYKGKKIRHD